MKNSATMRESSISLRESQDFIGGTPENWKLGHISYVT